MPEREYFSQSNIKPLWTHRAIALSQSIYGLSMFFQCCCDVQNLHVSPQEESRKYFIFGSVPLVRRVRVTALESSHWSQNVIWDFMINDFYFCGQSNNHDHYFDHHHFSISPSDWRQTRAKLPSCPAASSRTLSSDLSPRSPCDQSEDRASPLFPIKSKTFSANLAPPSWSG